MCRRSKGGCRMPDWLRDYEARTCSILAIISFSCAVTSFAVFTDSAVLSLTMPLKPAVCTIISARDLRGLTNCHWTSCRGSCTALFYNCTQIKVIYVLSDNHTSNSSELDAFDSVDNVVLTNITNVKFNEIFTSINIHNQTIQVSKLQTNEENLANLNNEAKSAKSIFHEVRSDTLLNNLQNNDDEDKNILFPVNYTAESGFTNSTDVINVTFKYSSFTNSSNETTFSSDYEVDESSDIERGSLISEYLKEFDGTELFNLNISASENDSNSENSSISTIPLYVNIFGCGYEPEELCEQFFSNYTQIGLEFPCLIGFDDEVFAIPNPEDFDFTKFKDPMRSLLLSLIPSGICALSACYIKVRRLYKMMPREVEEIEPKKKRPFLKNDDPICRDNKSQGILESRSSTKMSVRKNGQDRLPAFIKVQMPTPPPTVPESSHNIDREQFL